MSYITLIVVASYRARYLLDVVNVLTRNQGQDYEFAALFTDYYITVTDSIGDRKI
jgi:hypothetical protein